MKTGVILLFVFLLLSAFANAAEKRGLQEEEKSIPPINTNKEGFRPIPAFDAKEAKEKGKIFEKRINTNIKEQLKNLSSSTQITTSAVKDKKDFGQKEIILDPIVQTHQNKNKKEAPKRRQSKNTESKAQDFWVTLWNKIERFLETIGVF